jgi:hypothetical protein
MPADPGDDAPDVVATADTGVDPCALWTWETAGAPFVTTWCAPCHHSELRPRERAGAPAGVDFDGYAETLAHRDRIVARALSDVPTMPPAVGPDADEVARVLRWLACTP